MENLRILLRRLRNERGLSQQRLAEVAMVDDATISNVEQGRAAKWRPGTARRVLEALDRALPLSEADRAAFAASTGVKIAREAAAPPIHRTGRPDLQAFVQQAVEAVGEQAVISALISIVTIARISEGSQEGLPSLTVRHPPVQRPGFVERVEVDYAVPPPRPQPMKRRRAAEG